MSVKYTSNINKFLAKMKGDINSALDELGQVGVKNIKKETPVRTGELKKANDFEKEDDNRIAFTNEKDYAAFVEQGTYKQSSNPFMRRGIVASQKEFINILIKHLKV